MFDMNHGIITVNRGDSFIINMPINLGNPINPNYYTLQEDDLVYFGLMEPNQPFEFALVRKVFTNENQSQGILSMEFKPEDTECLLPGRYYYSLKLFKASDESVYTFVPNTKFVIID